MLVASKMVLSGTGSNLRRYGKNRYRVPSACDEGRGTGGNQMVVVPLTNPAANAPAESPVERTAAKPQSNDWLRISASGSLLAGGLLLLAGKHRAGLIAALTGTALTMMDQQETVSAWWGSLPGLMNDANRMINQVQNVVDNVNAQSAKIKALVQR
jgi:hypothetical protein